MTGIESSLASALSEPESRRSLARAAQSFGSAAHQLQVVDDDRGKRRLAMQPARLARISRTEIRQECRRCRRRPQRAWQRRRQSRRKVALAELAVSDLRVSDPRLGTEQAQGDLLLGHFERRGRRACRNLRRCSGRSRGKQHLPSSASREFMIRRLKARGH